MPQSFFKKSLNDLVSLINYIYKVIFNNLMPISGMFLILYCMHMSFPIHQRPTIQSYCGGMHTNTRRTFQGGAKCIPPFLKMSTPSTPSGFLPELRPQGFSLKKMGGPNQFLRERPWGRGWLPPFSVCVHFRKDFALKWPVSFDLL